MRVLERAGFTHEGTARAAVIKDGGILDECRFSILAGEWERRIACGAGDSGGGQ
jgi:RimJ/RimL family protein N-acetyltransferase